jgi:hypothetical protein
MAASIPARRHTDIRLTPFSVIVAPCFKIGLSSV